MQQQNHKLPLRLLLGGLVVLILAGALVFRSVQNVRMAREAAAQAAQLEANRAEAARRSAQIAALEKRLDELTRAYTNAMQKAFILRQQLLARNKKDALAKEVEAARHAVEDALDHNPTVVAMHQQLQQSVETSGKLSNQQAELLTKVHAIWDSREKNTHATLNDLFHQMHEAQTNYLASVGKKDLYHLTPDEAKTWEGIQEGYSRQIDEFSAAAAVAKQTPGDAEKELTQNYKDLGAQRIASDEHYTEVYTDLPATRARIRAEDPAIAALDRTLTQKNAQLLAATDATPELAAVLQELREVGKQRSAVRAELMNLRRTFMAKSMPAARTNG